MSLAKRHSRVCFAPWKTTRWFVMYVVPESIAGLDRRGRDVVPAVHTHPVAHRAAVDSPDRDGDPGGSALVVTLARALFDQPGSSYLVEERLARLEHDLVGRSSREVLGHVEEMGVAVPLFLPGG